MPFTRRSVLSALGATAAAAALRTQLGRAQSAQPRDTNSTHPPSPSDPLRPAFHYLPARNWINDPCAPVFFRGQYHLFHQYNPHASVWGDMHWAHAVSPDMVHWKRLPIALAPTPGGPDSEGVFTGSAFFHNGQPAVIYTGVQSVSQDQATLSDGNHNFRETQLLATSSDPNLGIWTKHPQPVIPSPPPGIKVTGFRDPTPFHHEGRQYLVVGSGQRGVGGMALLYRAAYLGNGVSDLTQWEYLHPLAQGTASSPPPHTPNPTKSTPVDTHNDPVDTGEMWECPDFFELNNRHILIYSTHRRTHWQVGDLDPATLCFKPTASGLLDEGRSFYAPKAQLDAHGNRILWGWLNETRPESEFAAAGWAGMISLPRVLTIADGQLRMTPLPALQTLRSQETAQIMYEGHDPSTEMISRRPVNEFTASLQQTSTTAATTFTLADPSGPLLTIRSLGDKGVHIVGQNEISIPADMRLPDTVPLHVFFDNSVLELFLGDRLCYTQRFYRRDPADTIATLSFIGNRSVIAPKTYALQSIWPA